MGGHLSFNIVIWVERESTNLESNVVHLVATQLNSLPIKPPFPPLTTRMGRDRGWGWAKYGVAWRDLVAGVGFGV